MMTDTSYQRASKWLDAQLVEAMRQSIIGRQLFAKVTQIPKGKFHLEYDVITDMGSALIESGYPDGMQRDDIQTTNTALILACIHKGYKIDRAKFNAFVSQGTPIETEAMMSAMQVVAVSEDDLLIQGWAPDGSTYKISGLYQSSSGNDYSTSKDFGTFGNPTDAVCGALALLDADNARGVNWNMTLNAVQFNELLASRSTNGVKEWPDIEALLNPVGGSARGMIRQSPDITAGTGLISPVDTIGRYIDLVIAEDARNVIGFDSKLGEDVSPIYGMVLEALTPRIKQSNSLARMSAI